MSRLVPQWTKQADGSFLDESGKVVFFSCERFVESICKGGACFMCGTRPACTPFNDEHVLPDWILREFGLFNRQVALPNGTFVRYSRYKIPCCVACNTDMGRRIETPVSELLRGGHAAVTAHLQKEGSLLIFVWLMLIFLKTHLRDRGFNITLDRRVSQEPISSLYEWEALHHLHTVARCFKTGAEMQRNVFGTFIVLPARVDGELETFDYADLYAAQVALVRFRDVAVIAVFNDSTAVTGHLWRYLDGVTGALSSVQIREVMVEAACCNLHLKERPRYASLVDLRERTYRLVAQLPPTPQFDPPDLALRGSLMEHALRPLLARGSIVGYPNTDDFWAKVREGKQTFLYDDAGSFIR